MYVHIHKYTHIYTQQTHTHTYHSHVKLCVRARVWMQPRTQLLDKSGASCVKVQPYNVYTYIHKYTHICTDNKHIYIPFACKTVCESTSLDAAKNAAPRHIRKPCV